MLEDFRQQAEEHTNYGEEAPDYAPPPIYTRRQFLGLSPFQRFIIAALLLGLTCMLSTLCLLVTQKVVPPILF